MLKGRALWPGLAHPLSQPKAWLDAPVNSATNRPVRHRFP